MRIVLLVADSVRADAPGFAGGPCRTPRLDRLAREGASFRLATTCAPWTVPSISAMVTGTYAHRLGLYRWDQPLPARENLFSVLSAHGYQVGSFVFDPGHLFSATPDARVLGSSQDLDAVVDWLEGCAADDLFALVHYWGTHVPYLERPMSVGEWRSVTDPVLAALQKEPGIVRPKLRAMYEHAIERLDGSFLPRLADATARHAGKDGWLLVVTSDHGESWGERAPVQSVFDLHGNHLRDEVLRVPMVLWGLPRLAGRDVDGLARTVDLMPTLLELAGVDAQLPGIDGRSLVSAMASGRTDVPSAAACASADFVDAVEPPRGPDELWTHLSLRTLRHKLLWDLRTDERSWFDLAVDPGEEQGRRPGAGEPATFWAELERERAACACAPPAATAEGRLRDLGYLG